MTTTNHYQLLADTQSYTALKNLLAGMNPEFPLDEVTDAESSIIEDVTVETIERKGVHVKGPHTYAPYGYDRPEVRVWVSACFDTETDELIDVTGRFVLRESEETVHFTIEDGDVTEYQLAE